MLASDADKPGSTHKDAPFTGAESVSRPRWIDPLYDDDEIGDGDVPQYFGDWHRQKFAMVFLAGTLVHLCQVHPVTSFRAGDDGASSVR
jgi:hypothetical protein